MKKLFFFKSQSSNNVSQPSTDKQVYWEKPTEKADKSVKNKHAAEDQVFGSTPSLRRSLSFSSGSLYDTGKGLRNYSEQAGSPHSSGYYPNKQPGHHSSRCRTLTPERHTRANFVDTSMVRNAKSMEQYGCTVSGTHSDLSDISSSCSSKVLDRYIDGEQMERFETKSNFSTRNQFENGNVVKKPPNIFAPVANDARKQKPKSRSFRETKTSQVPISSKDGCNNGYSNESPRKLAKHVVERLSQSKFQPKMRSNEFDSENPITIEDVYGRNLNRYANSYPDEDSPKNFAMDWHAEICDGSRHDESSEYLEKDSFSGDKDMAGENLDAVTDNDVELFKKFKEVEGRAVTLSEELEKGNFLQLKGLGVPTLIQAIRSLAEEKVNLAAEVSEVFEDRIAERALFREKLKLGRTDLEAQSRRLVKEKNEIQVALEKELDRRSAEWSLKLEKLQSEEHRLRERVRELAEQNVSLQREASTSSEREMESRSKTTNADKQLVELSTQLKEAREENHYLQKTLSELQEKTRAAEEEGDCIRRKYEEKVCECKDMHQAVSRLQRTCNDQERTIEGLRSLCEELNKKISKDNFDFGIAKLQIEHVRLTGVEHALRKEVESYRADADSLRRENIDLLNRLKNIGKEGGFSTFKLDRELQNRICCLQNQLLPLLTETSQHGRKFIEYVKTNGGFPLNKGPGSATCLDGHVLVEYEVKLQGLERAAENLATSTKTMSYVLQEKSTLMQEKSDPVGTDSQTHVLRVESQISEDIIRTELKSETLLTSLLRERLYSRELDVEQLQAELAAAIRGNDVLKSEVQNAVDNFSCINHKMKEVELQMIKKDETISQLHEDLQDCKKELAILRGILPTVSEERDMLWEEVKRHTESNMLLNSEVNSLRKRIEALDEDILMKEGQISILKDSVGKPFDLLATPEQTPEFCWTDAR
ncbi:myosin-15-like [Salvia divinorum]|uniref:Myosin-15-like n=1 Tax=Salvia divinorum TaxID=28513 RepID=A0ABD1GGT9_SALDI